MSDLGPVETSEGNRMNVNDSWTVIMSYTTHDSHNSPLLIYFTFIKCLISFLCLIVHDIDWSGGKVIH